MIDRFLDFTSYINQAYKYIIKIKAHEMKHFGLKAAHVSCLYFIGKYENGLSAVELVNLAMEDKAAISKVLAELRLKNLVRTDASGMKIYRAKYHLTDRGREIYRIINDIIIRTVDECGRGLTDEERAVFYRSLKMIVSNLNTYYDSLTANGGEPLSDNGEDE